MPIAIEEKLRREIVARFKEPSREDSEKIYFRTLWENPQTDRALIDAVFRQVMDARCVEAGAQRRRKRA